MRPSAGDAVGTHIIDHAVELVTHGGIVAMTTDALARSAGVSKATIYRRWKNRREILGDVAQRAISPVQVPDLGNLEKEIRYLLERRLEQYQIQGTGELLSCLVGAAVEDPGLREILQSWIEFQKSENVAMINRAMVRGELGNDISPDDLASMIAAPMLFRLTMEERTPDASLIEAILQMVKALAARPAGRRKV